MGSNPWPRVTSVVVDAALPAADMVVLAVPDTRIEMISKTLTPKMRDRALLVCLDPAASAARGG